MVHTLYSPFQPISHLTSPPLSSPKTMAGGDHEHFRGRAWSPDSDDSDNDTLGSIDSPRRASWRKKMSSWLSSGRRSHELPAHLEVQLGGAVVSTRRGESAASRMGRRRRRRSSSSAEVSTIAAGVRASLVGSCHGLVSTRGRVETMAKMEESPALNPFAGWGFPGSRPSGSCATTGSRPSGSESGSGSGGTFGLDDGESDADVSPRTSCRQSRPVPVPRIVCRSRSRSMSPLQVDLEDDPQPGAVTAATALGSHPVLLGPSWSAASFGSPGRQRSPDAFCLRQEVEGPDGIGMGRPQSPSPAAIAVAILCLDVDGEAGRSGSPSPAPRAVPTYTYDGSDWGGDWAGPGDQCSRRDTGFGNDRGWSTL